jgi:hypothetical protein
VRSARAILSLVLMRPRRPLRLPLCLCFWPLLFGPQRKRLVQFRCRRRAAQLLLEDGDEVRGRLELLLRRLQEPLLGREQIDETVGSDPSLVHVQS